MTTIPQTADGFKGWADRECGKWPADLQSLAYLTWRAMVNGQDDPQAAFSIEYCAWEDTQICYEMKR